MTQTLSGVRGASKVEKRWPRPSKLANHLPSYSTEAKNTSSLSSNAQRKAHHTSKWLKDLNLVSCIKLTTPPIISKFIYHTYRFSNHKD
jgi:hypothetical protein